MERFYTDVTYAPRDWGFAILLDNRPVKTPAGKVMLAPGVEELAAEIRDEWADQEEVIDPKTMPLTQLVTTAQDRIAGREHEIKATLLKYLDTDMICYYTPEPEALKARQEQAWQPGHDWAVRTLGQAPATTTGLAALNQDEKLHEMAGHWLASLDHWHMTIVQLAASSTGSPLLAMAFCDGRLGSDDLYRARFVEDLYRAGIYDEDVYGPDPHQETERTAFMREMRAAATLRDKLAAQKLNNDEKKLDFR
jgi:chaperone required for assembly of F1-ATPase